VAEPLLPKKLVVTACAVNPNALEATAGALAFYGIAGDHAARVSALPGTFAVALIDMLQFVTPDQVMKEARIEV
jgi:hydroxyethylthiazole kinase